MLPCAGRKYNECVQREESLKCIQMIYYIDNNRIDLMSYQNGIHLGYDFIPHVDIEERVWTQGCFFIDYILATIKIKQYNKSLDYEH